MGPMNADERAARLARAQYGLVSSRDTDAVGLSPDQVAVRLRARGWQRRERGLYVLPGAPPPSWRQHAMAAVLLGGPSAVASHVTAAALHGLTTPPLLPHITVPSSASARTKLARVHRADVAATDRVVVDGIPCTTASRAIVESASRLDRPGLEHLVDQALCGGRASAESIIAALERAGVRWPGARLVRSALDVWASAIEPGSPAEVRLLRRLQEAGAEGLVTQHEVCAPDGTFVARLDIADPDLRLGFEYDSDAFHHARRFDADERRHGRLLALGWTVHHVGKPDLLPSSTRIADLVRAAARRRHECA
jgi:hypothetical protein